MVRGLAARYIAGILARPDRTIVILNAQRLLADEERNVLHHLEITT